MVRTSTELITMVWPSGTISRRLIFPALGALALLNACLVNTQPRPESWAMPPVVDGSIFPPISGVYENQGVDAKGKPVSLAILLTHRIKNDQRPYIDRYETGYGHGEILQAACRVDLDLPENGDIDIRAVTGAGVRSWRLEQAKDQFKRINGMVRIDQGGNINDQQAVYHENLTLDLYRLGNDLIAHRYGKAIGVMFLIPAGTIEDTWARFHALETVSRTLVDPFTELGIGNLLPVPDKSRKIAISASRTMPFTEIELGCVRFLAAVDDSGKVLYLSTSSPLFRTPEGVRTGASVRNIYGAGGTPLTTEEGWGRYSVLPSGWCARFPEHALGTNSTGYPVGVVAEFFKRE
jgi:hypothetical protein